MTYIITYMDLEGDVIKKTVFADDFDDARMEADLIPDLHHIIYLKRSTADLD